MIRGLLPLLVIVASIYGGVAIPKVSYLDGRIVGGENANIEDFPYQVLVLWKGTQWCGGSILKPCVVVSAAHCFELNVPEYYTIQYGSAEKFRGKTVQVKRINNHEKFDARTFDYDISLLFLAEDIVFGSNAQPIALATAVPVAGTPVVVTGWSALVQGGGSPNILQKVEIEITSQSVCSQQYGEGTMTDRMICAVVNSGGKDACNGDSGSPLVDNNELVGVVSWGKGCAQPDYAGVYVSVSSVHSWINSKINE